jgi:hypothetical protein
MTNQEETSHHAATEALLRLHFVEQGASALCRRNWLLNGADVQHKARETAGFTRRYHVDRLVHYEVFRYVCNAIVRESEIKGWRREKKVALIEADNPLWNDLAADWGQPALLRKADSSRDEAALRNDKF